MTIQRGNAASIMGTVGETKKLEEIYNLVTPLKLEIYSGYQNKWNIHRIGKSAVAVWIPMTQK